MEALRVGCVEPVGPCSVCGAALCTGPGGLAAGPGPAPASPPLVLAASGPGSSRVKLAFCSPRGRPAVQGPCGSTASG